MAKNFPYFKFIVTEWLTGDIVYESFAAQGLFINICALYWQRDGVLTLKDINKRYKNPVELQELSENFFDVNEHGHITIKFLDEQLADANHISSVNSKNAKRKKNHDTAIAEQPINGNEQIKEEVKEEVKKTNLVEQWINDLSNDSDLEDMCRINGLNLDYMKSRIKDFKKKMDPAYKNKQFFLTHFRNWVNRNPPTENVNNGESKAHPAFRVPTKQ